MKLIVISALVLLFISACGGADKPSQTLHLRGYDIRASDYQAMVRAQMTANLVGFAIVCNQVEGLSESGLVTYFTQLAAAASSTPELPASATPRPGQSLNENDGLIAAKIIQGECKRTF